MKSALLKSLKEAAVSVLPVSVIVFILSFTPLFDLTRTELVTFAVCSVALVVGIALFSIGADLAMTPMGERVGSGLSRSGNLMLLLSVCFLLGFLITVAEPDLSVLASQVAEVINGKVLIFSVGIGVGIFLLISVVRMAFGKNFSSVLIYFYGVMFALTALVLMRGNGAFLPLALDSGGVTTGPITVPFIMALGVGIAATLGGRNSRDNSFGLVAMCSIGPIIAVLILVAGIDGSISYTLPDYDITSKLGAALGTTVLGVIKEVLIALSMIIIFFAVLQIFVLKLPKKTLARIGVGIAFTFVGLVIFLSAVSVGFMPVGYKLGFSLASNPTLLVLFGLVLGAVVVLAEPAVHVLTVQVDSVTDGAVSKRSMTIALSAGVAIAIGLSMLRIALDFSILYYVIPGFLLSLGLSFFVPGIYTAIAFDSGGVASGPLTSGFILPLAIGACCALQGVDGIMANAFGIVATVAMAPLITIQLLGFRAVFARHVRRRIAMRRILNADDEQIISFMTEED